MAARQAAMILALALAALSRPVASGCAADAATLSGGGSGRCGGAGAGQAAYNSRAHAWAAGGSGRGWEGVGTVRIALRGGGPRKSAMMRDQRRRYSVWGGGGGLGGQGV